MSGVFMFGSWWRFSAGAVGLRDAVYKRRRGIAARAAGIDGAGVLHFGRHAAGFRCQNNVGRRRTDFRGEVIDKSAVVNSAGADFLIWQFLAEPVPPVRSVWQIAGAQALGLGNESGHANVQKCQLLDSESKSGRILNLTTRIGVAYSVAKSKSSGASFLPRDG